MQITRFGGPEVLDVVDPSGPVSGDGEPLYEVSAAGVNHADTHDLASPDTGQPAAWWAAGGPTA